MGYPKVYIEGMEYGESNYINYGKKWHAPTLVEHSKNYKVFDLPLAGVDIAKHGFAINTISDFIFQVKRMNNTDLKYPIILDDHGIVCDGMHRICKAILNGDETIKAIRLDTMPQADQIIEDE